MLKKLLAVSLAAIICLSLVSCGKSGVKIPTETVDFSENTYQEVVDWALDHGQEDNVKIEFEESDEKAEGEVISQSTTVAEDIEKDGVSVKISSGKKAAAGGAALLISVPAVTGLSESDARKRIEYCGFTAESVLVRENIPAGIVAKVDPGEGTKQPRGSTVKMFVSSGGEGSTVTMPDVIGKDIESARAELVSKKLNVSGEIKYERSSSPKNTVILTSPLPGVTVASGYMVVFTVSTGENREKTLEVNVPVVSEKAETKLTVYIDGKLDTAQTKTVDTAIVKTVTVKASGKTGHKRIKVKLDGADYKTYDFNFDNCAIVEIN